VAVFGVKSSLNRDAWLMPTDIAAPHCQWLKEIVLPASAFGADADRVKALDPRIVFHQMNGALLFNGCKNEAARFSL
jgi:hypothetical protein